VNKELRKVFVPKDDEVTTEWRVLQDIEIQGCTAHQTVG
jgi:hypothetical protein